MNSRSPCQGQQLREVLRLYARSQRAVAGCAGTTNSQCHILTELARSGPITLNELGKRLLLEKSWVSRAVEKLVTQGLLGKQANPDDARSWIVALTPAGAERVEALNASLDGHAENLIAPLTEAQRATIDEALALLTASLNEELQAPCCKKRKCR